MDQRKLRLGISTCLLGEKVRYDGGHKQDKWITNTLGQFTTFIPICPEYECGMSIPRPPMHLEGTGENPRLVQTLSCLDLTKQMNDWIKPRIKKLKTKDLDGYIFKTKSPSCGLENIKIFSPNKKKTSSIGVGLFAKAFVKAFPLVPVADEERLIDPGYRGNFIERIFVMKRWRKLILQPRGLNHLMIFHTQHKLVIMSHSVSHFKKMEKLLAHAPKDGALLYLAYHQTLVEALRLHTTLKKHFKILQLAVSYCKSDLSPEEKKELLSILDQYKKDLVPLFIPITLINHYARKYKIKHLLEQYYLKPHPVELKLRNHV